MKYGYLKCSSDGTVEKKSLVEEKNLRGYQFDSLVYRYIRAREQMAEYEFYRNKDHDKEYYYKQARRDILRFCQILDEAIGEHD